MSGLSAPLLLCFGATIKQNKGDLKTATAIPGQSLMTQMLLRDTQVGVSTVGHTGQREDFVQAGWGDGVRFHHAPQNFTSAISP